MRFDAVTGGLNRTTLRATVTPLASIFGSGFLIIVPILERTLGPLAIVGATAVCALAYGVGTAIRHIISEVEPRLEDGSAGTGTIRIDRVADAVIVVAYVISVALYLRIMSAYLVQYGSGPSPFAEHAIAAGGVALIVVVGLVRGFGGLERLDLVSLGSVLVLTTVLGAGLFFTDFGDLLGAGVDLPPSPHDGLLDTLLVLGGIVITVQGFETVRYLGEEYDAPTRISASRISQIVSTSVYIGFIALATPLMGLGSGAGPDSTLLDITDRVLPALSLPLVICAVLSQFSAATADTAAAAGNLHGFRVGAFAGRRAYLLSGVAAMLLCWTVGTPQLVAIASRAFAAYYCLQALIAMRTSRSAPRRIAYGLLAAVMLLITLLAKPAG